MSCTVGKKKWRREPEFERQFQDGRKHITCPKCQASLGDVWEEKGHWKWRAVSNFRRQFLDDRRHLTCPRCSLLLGEVYWLPPTAWDWIRHIFSGNMGWKGRALVSLIAGMVVALALTISVVTDPHVGYCTQRMDLSFRNMCGSGDKSLWYLWMFGLPVSLLTYLIIRPCAMDRWGHFPWWLYEK